MEWNGMEWNGMERNGMEWNGMEWNERKRSEMNQIQFIVYLKVSQDFLQLANPGVVYDMTEVAKP
jgi:hypothetical protein